MERKNLIWGWLLVIVGTLFLLDYYELIDFSIKNLIRLWPVLLIIWGVSILPIARRYKNIGIIALIAGSLVLASTMPPPEHLWMRIGSRKSAKHHKAKHSKKNKKQYTINYLANDSTLRSAKLEMSMGAGKLTINRPSEQYWLDFEAFSNLQDYNGSMTTNGSKAHFIIDSDSYDDSNSFTINNNSTNKANLRLNSKLLWDIELDAGAIDMNADLSQIHVNALDIDTGASSINIKLGALQKKTHVKIDSGASSVDIEIPATAYCEIDADTFISGFDAPDFTKKDGRYITTDIDAKQDNVQKIYIDIDSAVSSVNIIRK